MMPKINEWKWKKKTMNDNITFYNSSHEPAMILMIQIT